jgi:hypothetical protein
VWEPARYWQPGSGPKPQIEIRPQDEDRAALKAYKDFGPKQREGKDKITLHVRLQGYPNGVRVVMQRSIYRHEQPCWRDETGRVW